MYFESADQCEEVVRHRLAQVKDDAWRRVVDELFGLTRLTVGTIPQVSEDREWFEGMLVEMVAEMVMDNGDEEPPEPEYVPYGTRDPESWSWAGEDEMLDAMGGVA